MSQGRDRDRDGHAKILAEEPTGNGKVRNVMFARQETEAARTEQRGTRHAVCGPRPALGFVGLQSGEERRRTDGRDRATRVKRYGNLGGGNGVRKLGQRQNIVAIVGEKRADEFAAKGLERMKNRRQNLSPGNAKAAAFSSGSPAPPHGSPWEPAPALQPRSSPADLYQR